MNFGSILEKLKSNWILVSVGIAILIVVVFFVMKKGKKENTAKPFEYASSNKDDDTFKKVEELLKDFDSKIDEVKKHVMYVHGIVDNLMEEVGSSTKETPAPTNELLNNMPMPKMKKGKMKSKQLIADSLTNHAPKTTSIH